MIRNRAAAPRHVLQGLPESRWTPRRLPSFRRRRKALPARLLMLAAIAAAAGTAALDRTVPVSAAWAVATGAPPCLIKGSLGDGGARLYHVPGGRLYAAARIDRWKGERWFCSEAEARAAGWRKAAR